MDHPRSRGVYLTPVPHHAVIVGSSPLARGLRRQTRLGPDPRRIIPARAGFTPATHLSPASTPDHPRSRGVYRRRRTRRRGRRGSSPLARGLPDGHRESRDEVRIIPARAGFTPIFRTPLLVHRDHPRSRGVYIMVVSILGVGDGSSPLARGLHHFFSPDGGGARIIPARAGFTGYRSTAGRRRSDHPRSRGVYRIRTRIRGTRAGSSPLARGLRMLKRVIHLHAGIIPARAGFTCPQRDWPPGTRDHPRSRGVYGPRPIS